MTDTGTPLPGDLTRRRFLQGSALAGTAAFLAACGTPPARQRRRVGDGICQRNGRCQRECQRRRRRDAGQ